MSKCISVQLSDGSYQQVQVAPRVKSLPQSDIDQLEKFIAYIKAKKRSDPLDTNKENNNAKGN